MENDQTLDRCRCCQQKRSLRTSHIISALAIRRLRRIGGHNKRLVSGDGRHIVQDGPKRQLLCDECEQAIGVSERLFNDRFLTPYYKTPRFRADYGDWLGLFAAANLWRILTALTEDGEVPETIREEVALTECTWRAFIRGETRSCGLHDLHLVAIDNAPHQAAYAEGAIDYDLVATESGREAYVVAKLPGLAFMGVIRDRWRGAWRHTQIDLTGGVFDASTPTSYPTLMTRYYRRKILRASRQTIVKWL